MSLQVVGDNITSNWHVQGNNAFKSEGAIGLAPALKNLKYLEELNLVGPSQ